jgi:hypothetical protein
MAAQMLRTADFDDNLRAPAHQCGNDTKLLITCYPLADGNQGRHHEGRMFSKSLGLYPRDHQPRVRLTGAHSGSNSP